MCTPITLTIELVFNNRVTSGLNAVEDHWTDEFGYAITPGHGHRDHIQVTLRNLDLGQFDSRGDGYLCEFLGILPGDLVSWWIDGN